MSLFKYYDRIDYLDLFSEPKDNTPRLCLGKQFASNIRENERWKISNYRMRLEEVKLQIIDAAEQGLKPPTIQNAQWIHTLYYNEPEVKFVWNEFAEWLTLNGLDAVFRGSSDDRSMRIVLNSSINIGKSQPLHNNGEELLVRNMKKRSDSK